MFERKLSRGVGIPTLVLLAAAWLAGWSWRAGSPVQAEIRTVPPPVHFQSGGERSEAVLQQIAGSLQRIETRLQRLEDLATRWAAQGVKPTEGNGSP
jgi:hypothetical protein